MESIKQLQLELAKQVFGEDAPTNIEAGLCIVCKEPALQKCHSEAGRREVKISGICESCWDDMFKDE